MEPRRAGRRLTDMADVVGLSNNLYSSFPVWRIQEDRIDPGEGSTFVFTLPAA